MTPAEAIAAAFPGDDPRVKATRIALTKLLRVVDGTRKILPEVTEWVFMAVQDPAIVFSEGDLPLVAAHLEAYLLALAQQAHSARDELAGIRLEWARFHDEKLKERGDQGAGQPERDRAGMGAPQSPEPDDNLVPF